MEREALAEIYTMHSFAPFSNLKIFVKNCWNFCCFFSKNSQILPEFCWIFAKFDQIFSGFFQNAAFFWNSELSCPYPPPIRNRRSFAGFWSRSVCCPLASSSARPQAAALRDHFTRVRVSLPGDLRNAAQPALRTCLESSNAFFEYQIF